MKKDALAVLILAVIALASLLTSAASAETVAAAPDPALAAVFAAQSLPQPSFRLSAPTCGPFCVTEITYMTPTATGTGSDCASAESSLSSQLHNLAAGMGSCTGLLGTCNFVITYTKECHLTTSGDYRVKGYATYSCKDTTC